MAEASVRCTQRTEPNDDEPIRIGLLSCPSLYDSIKAIHPANVIRLFEYDQRFAAYGSDFVHYDYNRATGDDEYLRPFFGLFDLLIADPPFLSEECIEKMSIIMRNLCRPNVGKIVLCSGQVVGDWAAKHLGLSKCRFRPQHERNLGNEFASYANFDLDEFIKTV